MDEVDLEIARVRIEQAAAELRSARVVQVPMTEQALDAVIYALWHRAKKGRPEECSPDELEALAQLIRAQRAGRPDPYLQVFRSLS